MNITLRYLSETKSDGVHWMPAPPPVPQFRQPIPRLAWSLPNGESHLWKYEFLAHTIRLSASRGTRFFLDTSFITGNEVPAFVWREILRHQVMITPLILYELRHWMENPHRNAYFHDKCVNILHSMSSRVGVIAPEFEPWNVRQTVKYYITLLVLRKLLAILKRDQFADQHGRLPTDEELRTLYQSICKDRGAKLASKGLKDEGKANFAADEELVVWAIFVALCSRRETVIITRDPDVLEQFYKLIYVLDTHYRSSLIADAYAANPRLFPTKRIPMKEGWPVRASAH